MAPDFSIHSDVSHITRRVPATAKAAMKYYQDEELMLKISQKMGGLTCAICGLTWSTLVYYLRFFQPSNGKSRHVMLSRAANLSPQIIFQ